MTFPPATSVDTDQFDASETYQIRARWVLPIDRPPIENGFVSVGGGRINELGRGRPSGRHVDLGDVAILPGLANAHTHLEFSALPQPLGTPGMELADWISEAIAARRGVTSGQPLQTQPSSRQAPGEENGLSTVPTDGAGQGDAGTSDSPISQGLQEAQRTGTTRIGEIATPPWSPPDKGDTPSPVSSVRIVAFAEVLGLSAERSEERLRAAMTHLQRFAGRSGLSPHAPYSTPPSLIRRCVDQAIRHRVGVAMHVAESPAERVLLAEGRGPFARSLQAAGLWPEGLFPWSQGADSLHWLIEELARAPRAMLVHGNDLQATEIERLSRHDQLTVVYCPRTHAYFRHRRHPVGELLKAGIRVALGTDSRASNPDLNLWREVRHLLCHRQDLPPADVLQMATQNGHDALEGHDRGGRLAAGLPAEMVTVASTAGNVTELFRDLAQHDARPLPNGVNGSDLF